VCDRGLQDATTTEAAEGCGMAAARDEKRPCQSGASRALGFSCPERLSSRAPRGRSTQLPGKDPDPRSSRRSPRRRARAHGNMHSLCRAGRSALEESRKDCSKGRVPLSIRHGVEGHDLVGKKSASPRPRNNKHRRRRVNG